MTTTTSEHEIRVNRAIYELERQWGNGTIDLNRLLQILKGNTP